MLVNIVVKDTSYKKDPSGSPAVWPVYSEVLLQYV